MNIRFLLRVKDRVSGALGYIAGPKSPTEEAGAEIVEEAKEGSPTPPTPSFSEVTALSLQELEYPLNLFTAGNLCHPYLSLPYPGLLHCIVEYPPRAPVPVPLPSNRCGCRSYRKEESAAVKRMVPGVLERVNMAKYHRPRC